uniref:8S globulin alpha isoform n=1 Tax=Vigna radiata TaxID=157791 RepID=Q198W5_VIGRA|nr:8S globulin alpha isoform precursor [Vigna radiata]
MVRARIPLLLLLGILFLASLSVSFGIVHRENIDGAEVSVSRGKNNPFYFNSDRWFHTLFRNQFGHLRVLQRFDQRSKQMQNLENYRVVEFMSKPNTLLLPHHADADFLLVVLNGRAVLTLVNPDGRDSNILEQGHAQKIPAGTTFFLVNPDDNENLRIIKLAVPVNNPHRFQDFFLSSTEAQQSYLQGFSKNILEASFDSDIKEISRVLFGEEGQQQQQGQESQQEGVIVELKREQIRELTKHAKSSSKKSLSSEDQPFNLRNQKPIYSNKLGRWFEITPEKNPQLRDLDMFIRSVDMKEGSLLLPHYNSKAIVILVINEGKANIELVGQREQQKQQEEQEESWEVQRYRAELSEDDVFIIPATYPVAINATSNLNFFAFGINAENNQRNFLAGEKDNVISEIPTEVLDVTFPASGEKVKKLIKKQSESQFVDAQPEQQEREEARKGGKGPFVY